MKNYIFTVIGLVQGVYYRKTVATNASKFNGYVKNMSDGTVQAGVTCSEEKLEEFLSILKQGSKSSRVDNIKINTTTEVFTNGFKIRY